MDAILFFKTTIFGVKNYESIECESIQEINKKLKENEKIKFIVIPEDKSDLINFPKNTERPVVFCITKDYRGYKDGKFNKILMSERTAKIAIEQWRE